MIGIDYHESFHRFLSKLDSKHSHTVEEEIIKFADSKIDGDVKHCTHLKSHDKVYLNDSNVIILYEVETDDVGEITWIIKNGYIMEPRVA